MFTIIIDQIVLIPSKHNYRVYVEGDMIKETCPMGYYKAFDYDLTILPKRKRR